MRLFPVLPLLSLLFGVGARASSLDSRAPVPHPLDVRDLSDVCASLDTELVVPDALGILTAVGIIDVCLCLSDIPIFIQTNVVAILAVTIAGEQVVTDALTRLIIGNAPGCNYPAHSTPVCADGNPCGFQCTDGFTASPPGNPTDCVCPSPSVICNGQCVAAGACPSSKAQSRQKRWVGSGLCAEKGPEWAACGVFGGGARAWECVDIAHDLESCGGCVLPLTAYSPFGVDCTALPGVADVSCLSGQCVIRRCLRGYTLAPDGTHCIDNTLSKFSQPQMAGEDAPAGLYGLEHVPFQRN
ncbi:hypothetical protein BJV74DRAFT_109935 [Russula compacta]|nr:hypothetical protein BJV74DRAFT_109935 [Russula compacta]